MVALPILYVAGMLVIWKFVPYVGTDTSHSYFFVSVGSPTYWEGCGYCNLPTVRDITVFDQGILSRL
jgi:hypothetical protein